MTTKSPEKLRMLVQQRIADAKQRLGGVCISCGTTENLQFHHRPGTIKRFNISQSSDRSQATFDAEIVKCDLLCGSCHITHHNTSEPKKTTFEHGTLTGYTHYKCRCDACKAANTEYNKQYYVQHHEAKPKPAIPEHGTHGRYYNHGCRCDLCKAAGHAYYLSRRVAK